MPVVAAHMLINVGPTDCIYSGRMGVRVKVDERGRITLPNSIRSKLHIKPGDELSLTVKGGRIIVEKTGNPFERLARILGDMSFEKEMRIEAEQEAMKEISNRRSS